MIRIRSLSFRLDFGGLFLSGYPIQRIEEGLSFVPKIDLTISSSNIPIQIELSPTPDAALSMLLRDRSHEFKDLANALNISTSSANWEKSVLQFCLDFNDCFKIFTEKKEPDERIDSDHQKIHKCMILMRQIAKGKMSMIEITNLQNIADMLAKEFKLIYKNI